MNKEHRAGKAFKGIWQKSSQFWQKDTNLPIQEAEQTPTMINPKNTTHHDQISRN